MPTTYKTIGRPITIGADLFLERECDKRGERGERGDEGVLSTDNDSDEKATARMGDKVFGKQQS